MASATVTINEDDYDAVSSPSCAMLNTQHRKMDTFTAPFTVLRLLTPLKMSYEEAKKRAEPYNKIVGELPDLRRDTPHPSFGLLPSGLTQLTLGFYALYRKKSGGPTEEVPNHAEREAI
ncbi:MAG TPA: hypothetical protein VKB81_12895 [Nitrospira sp.]|nr:hypothetical protein [Nitrospira sp.]